MGLGTAFFNGANATCLLLPLSMSTQQACLIWVLIICSVKQLGYGNIVGKCSCGYAPAAVVAVAPDAAAGAAEAVAVAEAATCWQ